MKKIIVLIFVVLLGVLGYRAFGYYNDTYRATVAYAQVPPEVPVLEQTVDDSGREIQGYHSYEYAFDFVLENGEKQTMHFELSAENPQPFKPNSYVKAEISKKRVVNGPNAIAFEQIPQQIQEQLKK